MLDISSTLSSGIVDKLRFMGSSHEESVNAPIGLLRQDVTLSTQLQDFHRRRYIMNEYRTLVATVRASLDDVDERSPGRQPSPPVVQSNPAVVDAAAKPSNGSLSSSSQALDFALMPSSKEPSPSIAFDGDTTSTTGGCKGATAGDLAGPKLGTASRSSTNAMGDDASITFHNEDSACATAVGGNVSSPRRDFLASSLLRAALSLSERYVPCFYCAKDVLHSEFDVHVQQCKVETETLLRKGFLNPIRFSEHVPQVPVPPLDCTEDELDDYAMECSKSIGRALVDCTRCRRKYNIHELQKHYPRCLGRSAGEVLGNYAAFLPAKR